METIVIHRLPLDLHDVEAIVSLLLSQDVFTPSFITSGMDIYNPLTYAQQRSNSGTETILLADRNVVTRWLALLDGAVAGPEHRVVAAIMAFSQCAGILIEPNIALYEAAARAGSDAANEELRRFRVADNLNPTYWADVALERSAKLSPPTHHPNLLSIEPVDFEMPLRRWRRNYVIALKVAELELCGGRTESSMRDLLHWVYKDFLIGGPAVILAAYYLAPNSDRKGLLKSLRSPDRERAVLGVRNAAWDITLLSDWITKIQEQEGRNQLTLLCSLDRKVVELARLLTEESPDEPTSASTLPIIFESLWGPAAGRRLSALLESYLSNADNPTRQLNRPEEPAYIDRLVREGEAFIRDWKPRST
jgi:hypothetical protein